MFLFTAYKRLMVVCRDRQIWALTRNIPSLCSFTSMFPIVETVSFFRFRSQSGERVAESPNVFPPQSLRNVVFRRGGVYESVFMKSNTARFGPSLRSPSLLQEPCWFVVLSLDPILSLSLNFVLPWFHVPYTSFFFAKNKRCLIISLFWKLVVSFHYRNCDLIWSIKRILKKCVQDQSCSFLSEQKVFRNDQRIEMIIFLLKLSVFLTCFFHNNEWGFFRKERERPRQFVFVTDNWSHQCKQL